MGLLDGGNEECLSCGKELTERKKNHGDRFCNKVCEHTYKIRRAKEAWARYQQRDSEHRRRDVQGYDLTPRAREVDDFLGDLSLEKPLEHGFFKTMN